MFQGKNDSLSKNTVETQAASIFFHQPAPLALPIPALQKQQKQGDPRASFFRDKIPLV